MTIILMCLVIIGVLAALYRGSSEVTKRLGSGRVQKVKLLEYRKNFEEQYDYLVTSITGFQDRLNLLEDQVSSEDMTEINRNYQALTASFKSLQEQKSDNPYAIVKRTSRKEREAANTQYLRLLTGSMPIRQRTIELEKQIKTLERVVKTAKDRQSLLIFQFDQMLAQISRLKEQGFILPDVSKEITEAENGLKQIDKYLEDHCYNISINSGNELQEKIERIRGQVQAGADKRDRILQEADSIKGVLDTFESKGIASLELVVVNLSKKYTENSLTESKKQLELIVSAKNTAKKSLDAVYSAISMESQLWDIAENCAGSTKATIENIRSLVQFFRTADRTYDEAYQKLRLRSSYSAKALENAWEYYFNHIYRMNEEIKGLLQQADDLMNDFGRVAKTSPVDLEKMNLLLKNAGGVITQAVEGVQKTAPL